MREDLSSVLTDLLTAFYQSFWFVLVLAVLFMFAYKHSKGIINDIKEWLKCFKTEKHFRRMFLLVFYTACVLFRTIFTRQVFTNPLKNVLGDWGFYKETAGKTFFDVSVPENIVMLTPFVFLLFLTFKEKILKNRVTFLNVLWKSSVAAFLFSLTIETLQLFLHLGTWQLSDLVYNTLGGVLGGVIYYIAYIIVRKHRNKKKIVSQEDEI